MAAPIKMINTIDVVFAVSIITPCMVLSILNVRQPLQTTPVRSTAVAIPASTRPITSSAVRSSSNEFYVQVINAQDHQ